jgi:hypothetical protein
MAKAKKEAAFAVSEENAFMPLGVAPPYPKTHLLPISA